MLEDLAINFLHGHWNYCLIKTDIDVMILFKFDVKYVKLNFKAIPSMEFSFDINLYLLCLYDGCLFMENHWKLLQKIFGKFEFQEFRLIENYLRLIKWNSDQSVWFNWYLIASQLIKCSFSIDQAIIEYQSSQTNCFLRIFKFFRLIETYIRSIKKWEFWIFFLSVFTWIKCKVVCN